MSAASLSAVSLSQLDQLLRLVGNHELPVPLTEVALQARGLGHLWGELTWATGIDRAALITVLEVAVAERRTRPMPRLELVWTGPEAKVAAARDTAVVMRELFNRAKHSVLIAGYRMDGGKTMFEPLQTAMRERGVEVRIFLHFDDRPGMSAEEAVRAGVYEFLTSSWPNGDPVPTIYYDPRTVSPGSTINLHAKCIVIDELWSLVGSANFTHNAHARNIEVGALIEDAAFATALTSQWRGLVDSRLVLPADVP
ncbi:MAG TPA: DISARM system phospholipase D-like protein DrmC [Kofleriaceae bacterium]|nr:DISARM system phospholipase D-like protein DrmC [Kofleriaceae bacterium]